MKTIWKAGALAMALGSTAALAANDKQGDVNVFLKGGIGGLTGALSDVTGTGPVYGVTLNLQPSNVVGFELAYDGGRFGIDDARIADGSAVALNGGTAMIKLGLPFVEKVKPFVAGGFGASYASVSGATDGLYRSDLLEQLPLAAGIEFNTGAVTAGLRGTWRMLLDEDFAKTSGGASESGNQLDASFTLGGRF